MNVVSVPTRIARLLGLSAFPLLCLGRAWAGVAAGCPDEPPAQESNEAATPADPGSPPSTEPDPVHAAEDDEGGHDRIQWGPLYPSITVVSAGAHIGPRLQLWLPDLAGPLDFHAAGIYSIRQYQFYTVQFGMLPQRRRGPPSIATSSIAVYPLVQIERLSGTENHLVLYASYRYRDYPEEDFYGVGFDTSPEDRANFGMRDHLLEAVTGYHFSPKFAVTVTAGLLETSLVQGADGGLPQVSDGFDSVTAPGLANPPDEIIFTMGALADLRDEPRNPHDGALLMLGLSRFENRDGQPLEFTRAAGEARLYRQLFTRKHVFAARALVSADWPDAGNSVPFYQQSMLGGSHLLRGYPSFRFRDDALSAFSAEYRFEPIPKLELALFYDAAQVAASVSELRLSEWKSSWGAGARVKPKSRTLVRFEVARSPETTRYIVRSSAAF